jgi:prepilin-type N-terminal cleavage/methylation domain-containing protein
VSQSRGFTLLEVLVALALTAVCLVVLQRATGDAARAERRLAADVQARGTASAALAHVLAEVPRAVPGTLHVARAPTPSTPALEFVLSEPVPEVVRYRLGPGGLERLAHPRFAVSVADTPAVPLLPEARHFIVRARDAQGWHDAWDEPRPPTAIAFDLTLASGEHLATSVALLAGATP